MPIIKVDNLSKKYILSHQQRESYTNLRDVFTEKVKAVGRRVLHPFTVHHTPFINSSQEDFWALKDVSFEINQGDRVGIIGRNGAGKSTLLKILSRITEPTSGRVGINGRVASLLEVGTGFHPELTGRENIFLNGAILGRGRVEINRKFDEIVAFAEVERFLDTPVKHYSSGMYVRLAFAVAAHLEPEILIVDEVLAVGDAQFQKKCLGKMEEVGEEGRTVLFVSHNMSAIEALCSKAILLKSGCIISSGKTEDVVGDYLHKEFKSLHNQEWENNETAPGNEYIKLRKIEITPDELYVDTDIAINIELWNEISDTMFNISLLLYKLSGECIFNTHTVPAQLEKGYYRGICYIPANLLNNDNYYIDLHFIKNCNTAIFKLENAAMFEVHDTIRSTPWYGKWMGSIRPKLHFPLDKV